MKKTYIATLLLSLFPLWTYAQRIEKVHGTSVYEVTDNTAITLRDAKQHAIDMAKTAAIKKVFGEHIISDIEMVNEDRNGESKSSYREVTKSVAKGDWLGNTKDPVIDIGYDNGILYITADVWGEAREYFHAKTDIRWSVAADNKDKQRVTTTQLLHQQPFYVHFQSPVDGYLALYVLEESGEATCLLPNRESRFPIRAGVSYRLFDTTFDPQATPLWFSTRQEREDYQLVLLFSSTPFSKCLEQQATAYNKLNTVNAKDFQTWLLRVQREDHNMIVQQKHVTVRNYRALE